MLAAASEYGPFAPVVGYAGAIMSSAAALFFMFGGKMEKWRPPDEVLPGTAQKLVLLLCGVCMVLEWCFATPGSVDWFLGAVAVLAGACVACFLRYSGLLNVHVYIQKIATGPKSSRDVRILGGRELLPDAEAKRRKLRVDTQSLLEGATYNKDLLWSRESQRWVKQRVLLFFILTLVSGTSALTGASFATQVVLTKKAAANVIRTTQSACIESRAKEWLPNSFQESGSVRCEGAGLSGHGQYKHDDVSYQAPPGYRIIGDVSITDVANNRGSHGAVVYVPESSGVVTRVTVPISCTSPGQVGGPGGWMNIRLDGKIERIDRSAIRERVERDCGAAAAQ
jgi:hypothetical protein